jgi:hypothetical protein
MLWLFLWHILELPFSSSLALKILFLCIMRWLWDFHLLRNWHAVRQKIAARFFMDHSCNSIFLKLEIWKTALDTTKQGAMISSIQRFTASRFSYCPKNERR